MKKFITSLLISLCVAFPIASAEESTANDGGVFDGTSTNSPNYIWNINGNVVTLGDLTNWTIGDTSNRIKEIWATMINATSATIGTLSLGFTQGSVTFADASGNLDEDNANFFWDDANDEFGIGTATPAADLEIEKADNSGNVPAVLIDNDDTTNNPITLQITNAGTGDSIQVDTTDFVVTKDGYVGQGASPTQALEVFPDTNVQAVIGRGRFGYDGTNNDVFRTSHVDMMNATDYALTQLNTGQTFVNAKSGQTVSLRVNNGDVLNAQAGGLTSSGWLLFQDPGTDANSYITQWQADNSTTIQTSSVQTIYGADPYFRISAPDDTGAETPTLDIHDTTITYGNGTTGIDYLINFNGEDNDGVLQWMEDEDNFYIDADLGIGSQTPTQALEVYPDTNVQAIIGRGRIGYDGSSNDVFRIAHVDMMTTNDYGFTQLNTGKTFVNAASGQSVELRINNGNVVKAEAGGVTIGSNTNVDYTMTFDGATSDGVFQWMEDEDAFYFQDDVGIGLSDANATLAVNGSQAVKRTDAGAGDYNPSALTTDYLIVADNSASARAITISTEDVNSGTTANPRIFVIKDEYGSAATYNLTISLETGNIDGQATATISGNYDAINLYCTGTNCFIF